MRMCCTCTCCGSTSGLTGIVPALVAASTVFTVPFPPAAALGLLFFALFLALADCFDSDLAEESLDSSLDEGLAAFKESAAGAAASGGLAALESDAAAAGAVESAGAAADQAVPAGRSARASVA